MAGARRGRSGAVSDDQLRLVFDADAPTAPMPTFGRPLPRRVDGMAVTPGEAPFDDEGYFFEPWWPGTRCFAFIEGGELRLQIDHLADPLAAFPELSVIADQVAADGVLIEGTLLVLDDEGRPDGELLRRRLADPGEKGGDGAFVASDLLFVDGVDIRGAAFEDRRSRLASLLADGDLCVVSRGVRREGETLADAVASLGLDAVSAKCLSGTYRAGSVGDDWLRMPVTQTPAAETRPLLVLLNRLPLD